MSTKIEWCDETINPLQDVRKGKSGRGYHCTKCSPGCLNCYAERINRIRGNGYPFDNTPVEFELIQSELEKPLTWKKPKRIFVQSMGDLFHDDVNLSQQIDIWKTMKECDWHTFLILTKRIHNLLTFYRLTDSFKYSLWPLQNVWLGVTVCNNDERWKIDELCKIPAAVRFVSIEPMLGPVDLEPYLQYEPFHENHKLTFGLNDFKGLDWVILGGESGPGARPMHPDWARSVRDQCQEAGVPFFFKQWGEWFPVESLDDTLIVFREKGAYKTYDWGIFNSKKVGKKKAGRLLDGREWNELPGVKKE